MADSNNEYPTTIGADAVFKGELHFEKGVRLLGKFQGQITSGGQLLIGEGATLTGDVKADLIRVDGQVKGNLKADTKIQLTATARLEGDLESQRLEVAEGAALFGRCSVGVDARGKVAEDGKTASMPAQSVIPAKSKVNVPVVAGAKK